MAMRNSRAPETRADGSERLPDPRHVDPPAPTSASALISDARWAGAAKRLRLSARELDVVRCIFDGCREKEIAARLHVGLGTTHSYVERLRLKLHAANKAAVVAAVFLALEVRAE